MRLSAEQQTKTNRLKTLALSCTQVTDARRRLDLCNTKLTDAGLAHLCGLSGLRKLSLVNMKVTDAGIEMLRRALPDCSISC